MGKLIWRSSTI